MGEEFQSDQDFALGAEDFPSERDYKLHCLRHSTSHIMAGAGHQNFSPGKISVRPPVKNRLYYHKILPRSVTPANLLGVERGKFGEVKIGLSFCGEERDKPER